jgi:hypothetical protein
MLTRKLRFRTTLSPDDAIRQLHSEIGEDSLQMMIGPINNYVRSDCDRRMFIGTSRPDGADLRKNMNSTPGELRAYNAFQPVILVRIAPEENGTTVHATMRPTAPIMLLLIAWTAAFAAAAALLTPTIHDPHSIPLTLGVFALMALMPWLATVLSLSAEAGSIEALLRALLERD